MLFLVNEAWTATSQGGPRPNNTQCLQNNRRAIIHTDADYILPEHICTVVGRWVRQLLLMLFFCKLNLADTNLWFSCNCPYVFSLLSQKFRDDIWEPNTSTQVLVDNVKLEWYQQLNTSCLCCPLGRTRLRHRLISVMIIHIKNLTSILIELCPFSPAWHFSNSQWPDSIIPAACSSLLRHLLHSITHFSLCFTFIWLSPPLDFPSFFSVLICLSFSPPFKPCPL